MENITLYTENKNIFVRFKFENAFNDDIKKLYYSFIEYFKKHNITLHNQFISDYDYFVDVLVNKNFIDYFVKSIAIDADKAKLNTRKSEFNFIWSQFDIYGNYNYFLNSNDNKFYYEYENIGD